MKYLRDERGVIHYQREHSVLVEPQCRRQGQMGQVEADRATCPDCRFIHGMVQAIVAAEESAQVGKSIDEMLDRPLYPGLLGLER